MKRSSFKPWPWIASVAIVLPLLTLVLWWRVIHLPRAAWKAKTLPQLATLSISNDMIRQQLEFLQSDAAKTNAFPHWISEQVLLMTNGQYLIYAYRHGTHSGFPPHLFLARGSDDRWYYSSYHFCRNMTMLSGDDQPGSITEFASLYGAKEFDGKSDECLKQTEWRLRE